MNIGTLTIEMAANVARLQNDMEQAKQVVSNSMDHINKAVDVAKNALSSLGAITSIVGFGALMEKTIQAAAEMHRMAERTGVSAEALSALRGVAKMAGTDMNDVATALQKLSRNMVEAQSGSGKAAEAMKLLGVSVQDSSGHLKGADQITLEVAKSLSQYKDGVGKTAVVMDIFGKAGANLLPMLAELAEKGNLNGKMTTEQTTRAYEFEKALNKLKVQFEGIFKTLVLDMIPAISKLSQLFATGLEVATAYWALFYGLPAAIALGTTALGSLQMTIALVKLEMVQGATMSTLFATSIRSIIIPTDLAAGALARLQAAAGVLLAAFAGWEIGKWLSNNFTEVKQAGMFMVAGLLQGFESLKYAAQVSWAVIKGSAVAAFDGVASAFATVYEKIANGLKAIGADGMAKSLTDLSDRLKAGASSTTSLKDEVAKITEEYNKNSAAIRADIDAQLDYERTGKAVAAATGGQSDALNKVSSDYQKLSKTLQDKIDLTQAEMAAGHALNAAEKERYDLKKAISEKTVTMTEAEAKAAFALIDSHDAQLKKLQNLGKAVASVESDYSKFTKTIKEKIVMAEAEIAAGHTLSEAEKARVTLLNNLKEGTVKMTAAQIQASKANLDLYESDQKIIQSQQEAKRYQDDIIAKAKQVVDAAVQEAAANERLVLTYGMTKSQIMQLDIARLEAKFSQADAIVMTAAEIDSLEKLIAAKKRSAEALGKIEGYDAAAKAAKDASDAWQRTADDISQSLSKGLMKGFTGTKGFITDFTNYLKGVFGKLVLQPIISPISNAIASFMVPNAAQAQGGGAANNLGLISNGYSAYGALSNIGMTAGNALVSAGSMFGSSALSAAGYASAVPGLTSFGAGSQAALLAAQTAEFGSAGLASTAAAGATATGAAGGGLMSGAAGALSSIPVIGWIALAAAAAAYFGSGKDRELTGVGLSGQLGTQNITRDVSWTKDGGWFNSDTSGTWKYRLGDSSTVVDGRSYTDSASQKSDTTLLKTITDQYDAMKKAASDYAKALGLDASYLTTRTQDFSINLGTTAEDMQKNIAELFKNVGNDISTELLNLSSGLAALKKEGESSTDTLSRLATDITGVNDVMKMLGESAYTLDAAGIGAAEKLIAAAGSLQNLQQISANYYQNFYSETERTNSVIKSLSDQFSKAGLGDLPKSREAFRALVEQMNKTGTPEQLAALMNMSAAFAAVVPVVDTVTAAINNQAAADDLARQRRQMEIQIMDLSGNAAGALAAKQQDEIAALNESLRPLQKRINALSAASEAEKAAADLAKQRTDLQIGLLEALGDSEGALALRRKQTLDATTDLVSKEILQKTYAAQNASAIAQKEAAAQQTSMQAMQAAQQAAQQVAQQASQQAAQQAQAAQQEYDQRLSAAKSALQTAYNAEASALQNVISKMQSFGTAARAMQESLISSAISPISSGDQYARAKVDLPDVITAAKEGDQGSLAKLQKFVELSQQSNSNFVDYMRDFAVVQNVLDDSASNAERLVKQNQSQLDYLKSQVDGLLNVNNSVLSVSDAIKALQDVMAGGMGDMAKALNGQYNAKNTATPVATTGGLTPDQSYGGLPGEGENLDRGWKALLLNNERVDKVSKYINAQYEIEAGYNPGSMGNAYYEMLNHKYFDPDSFQKFARQLGLYKPEDMSTASKLPDFDGSHADGLDFVPFDNYRAKLHHGERVKTAAQARQEDKGQEELINEVRLMRAELRAVVSNTKDTYKTLDRWTNVGLPATEAT